jgi:excisionase family DNA binding protein
MKKYLNIHEAAEYTSLAEDTLYLYGQQGKIPRIKVGRKVLFNRESLDEWMKQKEVKPPLKQ